MTRNTPGVSFPSEISTPAPVKPSLRPKPKPRIPVTPRILIVTDNDKLAETLEPPLRRAGFLTTRARDLSQGNEAAESGNFSVVVTTPQLRDGSWKELAVTAHQCRPRFAIILVARTFDLGDWAQALEDGAFDVLDALYELPRAVETVRRALWTEYLTGTWPDLRIPESSRIA
jgi:DNA-binding NtrC family response regulator